jgi:hypothetical protein
MSTCKCDPCKCDPCKCDPSKCDPSKPVLCPCPPECKDHIKKVYRYLMDSKFFLDKCNTCPLAQKLVVMADEILEDIKCHKK